MSFEKELEQGRFYIPECLACKKLVWPPSEFCDNCNKETSLRKEEFEGKIIEFSRQNEEYFCMVEFGDSIKLKICDLREFTYLHLITLGY